MPATSYSTWKSAPRTISCLVLMMLVLGVFHRPNSSQAQAPKPQPSSPLTPAQAVALFHLDEGLEIELAAAEPTVIDPVEIAFDAAGRMWVVEMSDYPNGPPEGGTPLGRVKILEDRDGDGLYEHATTFAEGLNFANGLQLWKQGAIVTSAPEITLHTDTDGDGHADTKTPLFEGFKPDNPQLRVSNPTLGIDNQVYAANGLRGGQVKPAGDKNAKPVDLGGRDFRFNPRTFAFDLVSGMGQFGLTFDAWGRRFVCDNRHHLRHVVFPDAAARRNPFLAIPEVLNDVSVLDEEAGPLSSGGKIFPISRNWTTSSLHAGRFTAACGVHIYEGDLLGAPYTSAAFTCEPTGNLVHVETLEPQGGSFTAKPLHPGVEFLATTDTWFRPVNLASGPDGALYVVDMYRGVIEHPEWMPVELKNRPDLRDGDTLGRIWRIKPKDAQKSRPAPNLANASNQQLLDTLGHPDAWHATTSQRLLLERLDTSLTQPLKDLATNSNRPLARTQAAYLLNSLNQLDNETLLKLLHDPHPRVRDHAVQLASTHQDPDTALQKQLTTLANDPDSHVRFQVALALADNNSPEADAALAHIAAQGVADRWTRLAVESSARDRSARLITLLHKSDAPTSNTPAFRQLLKELATIVGSRQDTTELNSLLNDLASQNTGNQAKLSPTTLAILTGLSEGLSRRGSSLSVALEKLPPESSSLAIARSLLEEATQQAASSDTDPALRREAIKLLASVPWPQARETLEPLLIDAPELEIRSAAIAALAAHDSPEVADLLLESWPAYTPSLKRDAVDAMLRQRDRATRLLQAVESGQVLRAEIDATHATRLKQGNWPEVKDLANKLLSNASNPARLEVLARYQPAVENPGDPARGRVVFQNQCATCHEVGGIGVNVGPDIGDNRTRTRQDLLTNILVPNQAIDGNYVSYVIATTDGSVYDGIISAETASSITLRRPEGRTEVILRSDVEELRSTGVSLMPEGLESQITLDQMTDLLTYLKDWRYLEGDVPAGISATPAP